MAIRPVRTTKHQGSPSTMSTAAAEPEIIDGVPHFVCKSKKDIPDSVKEHPYTVAIPNSVTEIGRFAFSGCTGLTGRDYSQ